MTGERKTAAPAVLRNLGWLGAGALLALGAALLSGPEPADGESPEHRHREFQRELRHYFLGLVFALLLTGIPFALVNWSMLPHNWLLAAIGAFAFVQVLIHFRFFLHIDLSKQKREDLEMILFSSLILLLMVAGTIWILTNLASRM